ncbi:hypothetical protein F5Y13DRAFT_186227 [Hypoxylon sp. FL1857]|nr:hypothetical protein F5Y13DRAFT_186227 [Hypoxylon sp. FL1857]
MAETIPTNPESSTCTIYVPTSEGSVPIIVADDESLCDDYESTGRSFCDLPASFRDSWQHACPSSSTTSILVSPDDNNNDNTTTVHITYAEPPLIVAESQGGTPGSNSAAQLATVSDSTPQQEPDMAPYYIGAAAAFGTGIIVMCIIGACMCRNRWGRRARSETGCYQDMSGKEDV